MAGNVLADDLSRMNLPWEEICRRVTAARRKEEVKYLYHATSEHNHENIVRSAELQSRHMFQNFTTTDEILRTNDIKGIWFCSTLFGGTLPTSSPYGTHRIAIPVAHIITPTHAMFFERAHHYGPRRNNQYIRFILVNQKNEAQARELVWCQANLRTVEINDNPIFTFDAATGIALCVRNENRRQNRVHLWVEILVIGDVLIPSTEVPSTSTEVTNIELADVPATRGILTDL